MGKIERKYLAHYIDANIGGEFTSYVRLGKDLETYAEELNPQVNIQRNLSGQPFVNMEGYQVQSNVEPFYAEYGSLLFEVLSRIANNRITDDSCKTTKVDALLNEDGTQVWAYREDCWIVPVSIGGDTSGVQIPFNVYCAGNRVYGTFDTVNKTFAETGEEPPISPFTTLSATNNGIYSAPAGKGYSRVTVSVHENIQLVELSITGNGTYVPSSGYAYNQVTAQIPGLQGFVERTISGVLEDSTITKVGNYAFQGCTNLNGAILPECSVISSNAFAGLQQFFSIIAPSCTSIGNGAFQGCIYLSQVSFPECTFVGSSAFLRCYSLQRMDFPKCSSVGDYAFRDCSVATYASFPECERLNYGAFFGCRLLESISFPKMQSIGHYALSGCASLALVSFGSYMSYIGASAFNSCFNLVSLYMMYSGVVSLYDAYASVAFNNTPMYDNSTSTGVWGTIYVPSSLLTAYQEDSKWSVISSRFSGI